MWNGLHLADYATREAHPVSYCRGYRRLIASPITRQADCPHEHDLPFSRQPRRIQGHRGRRRSCHRDELAYGYHDQYRGKKRGNTPATQ